MLKFTPPELTGITRQYIRSVGTSTLPVGNTYWFEELPQLPFTVKKHNFILETSKIGEKHLFYLNEKLYKTVVPNESPFTIKLVLNPGIYEYKIVNDNEETTGAFQISVKEFFWNCWIQALEKPFQDLNIIEGRFKNPLNLILLEITYPPEILSLSNSPWALRNFSRASSTKNLLNSFDFFASGLFHNNTIFSEIDWKLTDYQKEYSKISIQFSHPTISRRGFFLQKHRAKDIKDTTWNYALIEEFNPTVITPPQILNYLSTITVRTNLPVRQHNLTPFKLYDKDFNLLETLTYVGTETVNNQELNLFTTTQLNAGSYVIVSDKVSGYIKSENLEINLPPKENQVVDLFFFNKTNLCIRINEPSDWTLTGRNENRTKPDIIYNGNGSVLYDVEIYFLDGYTSWTLDVLDRPGFTVPKGLEVFPHSGSKVCILAYLKPTEKLNRVDGTYYQKQHFSTTGLYVQAQATEVTTVTIIDPTRVFFFNSTHPQYANGLDQFNVWRSEEDSKYLVQVDVNGKVIKQTPNSEVPNLSQVEVTPTGVYRIYDSYIEKYTGTGGWITISNPRIFEIQKSVLGFQNSTISGIVIDNSDKIYISLFKDNLLEVVEIDENLHWSFTSTLTNPDWIDFKFRMEFLSRNLTGPIQIGGALSTSRQTNYAVFYDRGILVERRFPKLSIDSTFKNLVAETLDAGWILLFNRLLNRYELHRYETPNSKFLTTRIPFEPSLFLMGRDSQPILADPKSIVKWSGYLNPIYSTLLRGGKINPPNDTKLLDYLNNGKTLADGTLIICSYGPGGSSLKRTNDRFHQGAP